MSYAMGSVQLLFDRIVHRLAIGGDLTAETLAFIDTSFSLSDPGHLAAFIRDDEGCERDTLLDLIFFPDPADQINLEPLLESGHFTADDERKIIDRLLAHAIDAPIRMPDGRQLACIQLPDFIKSRYLERLNITWYLPRELAAAIDNAVSAAMRIIVKVRLRNSGFRPAAGQIDFFCRFFARMDDGHPDYLACLDLALVLLDKTDPTTRVYDLLADHKRVCFRSLQQARRFETLLRRANMETLMLQGVRAPQESPQALLHRMGLLDRICYGVFGRTEIMELPMEETLHAVADLDSPAAAVRSLLR